MGYHIKYTSTEKCPNEDGNYLTVDLRFICDPNSNELLEPYEVVGEGDTECEVSYTYIGSSTCGFDLGGLISYIARYIGWIMIIGGLIMTFYGYKFLNYSLAFIVSMIVVFFIFFACVNLRIVSDPRISEEEGAPWGLIAVAAVSLIVGGLVGYCTYKFIKAWSTTLLGAFALGSILFFIIDKIDVAEYIKFCVTAIGAMLGGYAFQKADRYLKAGSTALLGSCLLMQGLSFYVATPDTAEMQKMVAAGEIDYTVYGLVAGMVIFTALGAYVQLKYFVEDIAEESKSANDYTKASKEDW